MRVFLGLSEIAGYYRGLHHSLREIGVDSVYGCGGHPFGYADAGIDLQPWPVRLFQKVDGMRLRASRSSRFRRAIIKALHLFCRVPLLLWALLKCDVFVFGFGSCFFMPRELRLFRLLGKRTIHVFHGSDNRPRYMDGGVIQPEVLHDAAAVLRNHRQQHRRIKWIEKYSSCLVSHPATAQYFQRPYVNWLLATGIPFTGEGIQIEGRESAPGSPVVILHCPSHPALKGTAYIRGMIGRLKAEGHLIDFREIINRPNAEVLQELKNCDFVIDQAYADYPMAGFATEAAHFGKPAVVGGYAQKICGEIEQANGLVCDLYCLPEDMEGVIRRLITDPEYRRQCGLKAKAFVESAWSRRTVAQNWLRLLKGEVPDEWFVRPEQTAYIHGCGLPENGLKEGAAFFLRHGDGLKILFLEHRPDLQAGVVALAGDLAA
ncbi:MAG TPA: hypothetical protein VG796_28765 [Verrucomicrobiales bacterium]|nr:hypothetical protein [Verrucomicrobiales bacterium]